ncbi:hypothetical protein [Xylophilus sp. ASV27]|uniref:hypothetical protein n=1 Tax=Xylophilus sp. ASV27 TaxID=2795129 RepID=UPI00351C5896
MACPLHEAAIQRAGIAFSGYPSLLASVGHGAAMDIAGRGKADPRALLHTIALVSGDGISYKINSRKPRHHLGYNVLS